MSTPPDDPRIALAEQAGAIDPDLLALQFTPEALTDPQAAERECAELPRRYPRQFCVRGRSDGGAGLGSPVSGPADMNALIRRAYRGGR